MINVKKLNKKYGSETVLNNISFTIKEGDLGVIYGRNGAGKTTLIKSVTGFIEADFDMVSILSENKPEVGVYLGHEMLLEKLTVREYLHLSGTLKKVPKSELTVKIKELSEKLNFNDYLDKYISKLSFGTKSKVLFASALLNNPKVLILDEPFTGMDLISIKETVKLLQELKEKGCSVLVSSHQVDVLDNVIDRVIILKDNVIVFDNDAISCKGNNQEDFVNFILSRI